MREHEWQLKQPSIMRKFSKDAWSFCAFWIKTSYVEHLLVISLSNVLPCSKLRNVLCQQVPSIHVAMDFKICWIFLEVKFSLYRPCMYVLGSYTWNCIRHAYYSPLSVIQIFLLRGRCSWSDKWIAQITEIIIKTNTNSPLKPLSTSGVINSIWMPHRKSSTPRSNEYSSWLTTVQDGLHLIRLQWNLW